MKAAMALLALAVGARAQTPAQCAECVASGAGECFQPNWAVPCYPGGRSQSTCEGAGATWCPALLDMTPPTPAPPTPPPTSAPPVPPPPPFDVDGEIAGFWSWTWSGGSAGPAGANLAVSFSGWADGEQALSSSWVHDGHVTFLDLGGGNSNGAWSAQQIAGLTRDWMRRVKATGFAGIAWDIEVCSGVIAPAVFHERFVMAREEGLINLVSYSHSKPYACSNGAELVRAWIADPYVDMQSPQLYTTGNEPAPDFVAREVQWREFKNMAAGQTFVPSIANVGQYGDVKTFFDRAGVPMAGYIQWQQTQGGSNPPPVPGPPTPHGTVTVEECRACGQCYQPSWLVPCYAGGNSQGACEGAGGTWCPALLAAGTAAPRTPAPDSPTPIPATPEPATPLPPVPETEPAPVPETPSPPATPEGKWWPDWSSRKCLNGGAAPWQVTTGTAAACCKTYFSWRLARCIAGSTPATSQPALTPVPAAATPEPATPQPATPQPATPQPATPQPATPQPATPQPTTATPEPATPLPPVPTESPSTPAPVPETPSPPATPEGKWWPDWSSRKCLNGGAAPWQVTTGTAAACCKTHMKWRLGRCIAASS